MCIKNLNLFWLYFQSLCCSLLCCIFQMRLVSPSWGDGLYLLMGQVYGHGIQHRVLPLGKVCAIWPDGQGPLSPVPARITMHIWRRIHTAELIWRTLYIHCSTKNLHRHKRIIVPLAYNLFHLKVDVIRQTKKMLYNINAFNLLDNRGGSWVRNTACLVS